MSLTRHSVICPGVQVARIAATNFCNFEALDLHLHPNLTVIVGANGVGKSAILAALARLLQPRVEELGGGPGSTCFKDQGACRSGNTQKLPSVLKAEGTWMGESAAWTCPGREGETEHRRVGQKAEAKLGRQECFHLGSYESFPGLEGIFASLSGRLSACGVLEAITEAVNEVLASEGWQDLRWDAGTKELTAKHQARGRLPVNLLGSGTRSVMELVGDIAYHCVCLNPQLGAAACKKSPGLVMIDEVDMHLHPRWQQRILGSLQAAFPSIQFVVTTHSPQVVSTVPAACVRMLVEAEGGGTVVVQPAHSPLARSSAEVLSDIFDVSPHPDLPILEALHRYEQWVRRGKEEEETAKDLKRQLDDAGVDIPNADLELWRMLARTENQAGH